MAPLKRICYQQARHSKTGDFLRIRDAVRVKSVGAETNFGCIARLFKHEKTGANFYLYFTDFANERLLMQLVLYEFRFRFKNKCIETFFKKFKY